MDSRFAEGKTASTGLGFYEILFIFAIGALRMKSLTNKYTAVK